MLHKKNERKKTNVLALGDVFRFVFSSEAGGGAASGGWLGGASGLWWTHAEALDRERSELWSALQACPAIGLRMLPRGGGETDRHGEWCEQMFLPVDLRGEGALHLSSDAVIPRTCTRRDMALQQRAR